MESTNISVLRKAFETFDKDKDGEINLEEFKSLIRSIEGCDDMDLKELFEIAAGDSGNTITFREFHNIMSGFTEELEEENHSIERESFNDFDTDSNNFISLEELKKKIQSSTEVEYSEEKIDEITSDLMDAADEDHDGRINFKEFMNILEGN
jgi:calcium-binding protein CML